jgi:hypothetical protein
MDKIKKTYVIMPNLGELGLDCLIETSNELRNYKWEYKKWTTRPALIDKSSSSSIEYGGQNYDSKYFDLVQNGWTHDHCEICSATITDGDDGFNIGNTWICQFCHENFIEPKDFDKIIEKFKKIKK